MLWPYAFLCAGMKKLFQTFMLEWFDHEQILTRQVTRIKLYFEANVAELMRPLNSAAIDQHEGRRSLKQARRALLSASLSIQLFGVFAAESILPYRKIDLSPFLCVPFFVLFCVPFFACPLFCVPLFVLFCFFLFKNIAYFLALRTA